MDTEQSKQLTQIPPEKQRMLSRAGFGFLPQSFEELWNYAKEIANTDFVPTAMRGKTGAVLAAWQTGQDLGLPPMASLSGIAIINGRPSVHSDAYWALVVNHPMCEWFKETPPDEALTQGFGECTIKRRGNPAPITRKFHMHEAEKANLLGKDNWKNYPGDMLQNRARHRAGSDAIPEATQGILPSDVARDLPSDIEVTAETNKPIALPKPKETKADENKDSQRDHPDRGPQPEAGQRVSRESQERPTVEGDRGGDTTGKARKGGGAAEKKTRPQGLAEQTEHIRKELAAESSPGGSGGGGPATAASSEPEVKISLKNQLLAWIKVCSYDELHSRDKKINRIHAEVMDVPDVPGRVEVMEAFDIERRTRPDPSEKEEKEEA